MMIMDLGMSENQEILCSLSKGELKTSIEIIENVCFSSYRLKIPQ